MFGRNRRLRMTGNGLRTVGDWETEPFAALIDACGASIAVEKLMGEMVARAHDAGHSCTTSAALWAIASTRQAGKTSPGTSPPQGPHLGRLHEHARSQLALSPAGSITAPRATSAGTRRGAHTKSPSPRAVPLTVYPLNLITMSVYASAPVPTSVNVASPVAPAYAPVPPSTDIS